MTASSFINTMAIAVALGFGIGALIFLHVMRGFSLYRSDRQPVPRWRTVMFFAESLGIIFSVGVVPAVVASTQELHGFPATGFEAVVAAAIASLAIWLGIRSQKQMWT